MPVAWLAQQSNFRQPVTKSLVASYVVLQAVTKTVTSSYTVRYAPVKTLAATYHIRSSFSRLRVRVVVDAANGVGFGTAVASAPVGPIDISAVAKTLTVSYNIRISVSKTLTETDNVIQQVSKSLEVSYNVKQQITKALAASYTVRQQIAKSVTSSYNVKQQIVTVLGSTYGIGSVSAVTKSLVISYVVRQQIVVSDTADYRITLPTAVQPFVIPDSGGGKQQKLPQLIAVRVDLEVRYFIFAATALVTSKSESATTTFGEFYREELYVSDVLGEEIVELLSIGVL